MNYNLIKTHRETGEILEKKKRCATTCSQSETHCGSQDPCGQRVMGLRVLMQIETQSEKKYQCLCQTEKTSSPKLSGQTRSGSWRGQLIKGDVCFGACVAKAGVRCDFWERQGWGQVLIPSRQLSMSCGELGDPNLEVIAQVREGSPQLLTSPKRRSRDREVGLAGHGSF